MISAERRLATDPFSPRHKLFRLLWNICWICGASWTPPALAPWRRWILKAFGAKMAKGADVRGGAKIWYPPLLAMEADTLIAQGAICYNQAMITVREGAIVSQRAHLCAGGHDIESPLFAHVARSIEIGANAWVAAESFVGPGVRVGEYAVLGARAVTFRNLDATMIYIGNPAIPLRERSVQRPQQ